MSNTTPCTKCGRESDTKFCPHCGAKQAQRFPENELTEYLLDKRARAKELVVEANVAPNIITRRKTNLFVAELLLRAHHAMTVELKRPFALPADMQADDKPEAPDDEPSQ